MKKRILRQITVISMILCLVSGLGAILFNPDFDSSYRLPPGNVRTELCADGWRLEWIENVKLTQPDGVEIDVEVVNGGVNNPMCFNRINGFTIVFDRESRYWCWARQAEDGTLESTGYPTHLHEPEALGLEKDIRMSNERAELEREWDREFLEINFGPLNYNLRSKPTFYTSPHERHVNKIIIYVTLADHEQICTFPNDTLATRFTDLNNYYHATSYGNFSFTPHFFSFNINAPHITSDWLTPRNFLGNIDNNLRILRERQIAIRGINYLSDINFDIDADSNDVVDTITIIFGGLGGEPWRTTLGYYIRHVSGIQPTINGKRVANYIVHYENNILCERRGLFLLAHEFGLNLGFTDMLLRGESLDIPAGRWCAGK